MQAPMPTTLPIMPSPVNITGRDELIQGGFMPQPVLPQLELPTTPVSIPAITSPVMPQMPVDLGMIPAPSVNLPLPQTKNSRKDLLSNGKKVEQKVVTHLKIYQQTIKDCLTYLNL